VGEAAAVVPAGGCGAGGFAHAVESRHTATATAHSWRLGLMRMSFTFTTADGIHWPRPIASSGQCVRTSDENSTFKNAVSDFRTLGDVSQFHRYRRRDRVQTADWPNVRS